MPHVIRTRKVHHIVKVDYPRQPEALRTWGACHSGAGGTSGRRSRDQH